MSFVMVLIGQYWITLCPLLTRDLQTTVYHCQLIELLREREMTYIIYTWVRLSTQCSSYTVVAQHCVSLGPGMLKFATY